MDVAQPDGQRFKGRILGDEYQGWVETESGYTILKDAKTGNWEYAESDINGDLKSTYMKVMPGGEPPDWVKPHLKPRRDTDRENQNRLNLQNRRNGASGAPGDISTSGTVSANPPVQVSGAKNLLIILVNFSDRALVTTASSWNSVTFDSTAGNKSLVNYYNDNSFGKMSISSVSHTQSGNPAGIVTVSISNTHPNSGNNWNYTVETSWINAALAEAASYVDFRSLDTNNDGVFQNSELIVYFVCAGYEAACCTAAPNIWAHAWGGGGVSAGGVSLNSWALNGELYDTSNVQLPFGVIAHELGHSMCGLPDLYDTTYTNAGLGIFSLMAYGSWGACSADLYMGTTPVSLDAWSRQYLEWSTPTTSGGTLTFAPALSSTTTTAKLINASVSSTEYFLAENRYPTGWDLGMEGWLGANWGGGILILHVDDSRYGNAYAAGSHQMVMAEEASSAYGSLLNNSSVGNVYNLYWSGNNAEFTAASNPNSNLYDGTPTGISFSGVSQKAQTMTAELQNAASTATSVASSLNPATYGSSVTLTATVSPSTATGSVTFKDGAATLYTGTISGGAATYSTSSLNVGPHSITAVYGGDTSNYPSTSPVLVQTVNKSSTTTSVASSPNPSTDGSSVTFTATVSPSTATGTVTFKDGNKALYTGSIANGKLTYATSTLSKAKHRITATYNGDANYESSTSAKLTQTVTR